MSIAILYFIFGGIVIRLDISKHLNAVVECMRCGILFDDRRARQCRDCIFYRNHILGKYDCSILANLFCRNIILDIFDGDVSTIPHTIQYLNDDWYSESNRSDTLSEYGVNEEFNIVLKRLTEKYENKL